MTQSKQWALDIAHELYDKRDEIEGAAGEAAQREQSDIEHYHEWCHRVAKIILIYAPDNLPK